MAMDAVASVPIRNMQSGRVRQVFEANRTSCTSSSSEAFLRCCAPSSIAASACTSGQQSFMKAHGRGRKVCFYKDDSQAWRFRLSCGLSGGRMPTKRGSLHVRASHAENILPLSVDNDVASLESLLDASPNQRKSCPPSKAEERSERLEALIERVIFDCRFLTLMAVVGSLAGSLLCFFKGSLFVAQSFLEYFQASWQGLSTSQVVFLLVEAVDVYLMGTVMLIFGMGLYELFVSALEVAGEGCEEVRNPVCGSNLFGLFRMRERPKWLEIRSLDELKTKLGHVIVMILLVGMFEKSKKVPINSGVDLLCFSASILLSSGCLYLLSKLHSSPH